MSRTWHHGLRNRERLFRRTQYKGQNPPAEPTPPKMRRHAREEISCFGRNPRGPGWWINMTMNRPWRRETKQLIHRYMRDGLEEPMFPNGRKPHVYYF